MRTEESLAVLEEGLKNTKWNILGLCETRLTREKLTTQKSGHNLYQNNSASNHHGGDVAFLINRDIKLVITKYQAKTNRVIYVTLKLSRIYTLQVIDKYAPISSSDDDEGTCVRGHI